MSPDTSEATNVMAQYRPCYRAGEHPPLDRALSGAEYRLARDASARLGLHRLDPA